MHMKSVALVLAAGGLWGGCAAQSASDPATPALAAYFDCVREKGIAISAHRTVLSSDRPENAVSSILETGRAIPGAIVEMDAAMTRDGVLVLMHDETMDRTTTGQGRVADLTLAQFQQARLVGSDGARTEEAPPTLTQALDAAGLVRAIASIDLKPGNEAATLTLARAVVEAVRQAGAADRVILITYSPETARAVAEMAPEMMISAGIKSNQDLSGLRAPQILAWTGAGRPDPSLWRSLKGQGVEVQFGTLGREGRRLDDVYAADGDVSEYRELFDQGVSIIATDAPQAVGRVLGAEVATAATCPR